MDKKEPSETDPIVPKDGHDKEVRYVCRLTRTGIEVNYNTRRNSHVYLYLKNNEASSYRCMTNLAPSWLLVLSKVIVL